MQPGMHTTKPPCRESLSWGTVDIAMTNILDYSRCCRLNPCRTDARKCATSSIIIAAPDSNHPSHTGCGLLVQYYAFYPDFTDSYTLRCNVKCMLLQLHFKHDRSNSAQLSPMSFNQMFCAICFFTYSVPFPLITLQERFRGLCADPQKSRPCIRNESLDTVA